jgi:amino acid adenylation domain-containing protein
MIQERPPYPEIADELIDASNLSMDQLLMWVGQKLRPDSPVYNFSILTVIPQTIDVQCFRAAFQTLVNSSDAMRMVIEETAGVPNYRITQPEPYDLPLLDFSKESDPESRLRNWVTNRTHCVFDFNKRLFDSALIQLASNQFAWFLNQHHVISDGLSGAILRNHISELYGQSVAGTIPDQIELPRFTDHIEQDRARRSSEKFREIETYWTRKLTNLPEEPSFHGGFSSKHDLDAAVFTQELTQSQHLKEFATNEGISSNSIDKNLLLIFATLLASCIHRYGSNKTIVIGIPYHGRRHPDSKKTIGLLFQVLPLRLTIEKDDTFVSLMKKIDTELAETLRHSPYAAPSLANSYDVLLNYHVSSLFQFQGVQVQRQWIDLGYCQKSLMMNISDFNRSGKFTLSVQMQSAVFTPEQQRLFPQHFLQLLYRFLENPNQSIHYANFLTPEENICLQTTWNETAVPRRQEQCLHHLFEAQAEVTPNAVAVKAGSRQLTYEELNQRSNNLAHHLIQCGVGPESLVGICVERSLEMMIGLLGILKAGAGYVPLDPSYPPDRLEYIASDANISFLITQTNLLDRLPSTEAPVIDLELASDPLLGGPFPNPNSPARGDNVAYVMYTSGSTGIPKGVVVLHRGVCNYLLWRLSYFPLTQDDRVLQKTSFGFVDSIWELFEPLMVGAQLIMAEPDRHNDPAYLVQFINDQQITAADLIPSMLQMVLEVPNVEQCHTLRRVTTGSETVTHDLQTRFFKRLQADLYNLYGPTEASIASTCWKCEPANENQIVPIGRPIANTQIYLLDQYLQPVPSGLPGEIHIGGIGLARGYLNKPELTAEKFIAHPFGNEPEARLYKTGDLARYLPDGNLDFLGRADNQVKIRGYRIELGEIEAVLDDNENIQKSLVVVREDEPGIKRLVAYLVSDPKNVLDANQIQSFLRQKLPDYMVPSAYVALDQLPTTPNGKTDRRALPAPDAIALTTSNDSYLAPNTTVQKALAETWQDVFKVDQIGLNDDFFKLGGHSLLAFSIISRLRKNHGLNLSFSSLFFYPTIAELAKHIQTQQ